MIRKECGQITLFVGLLLLSFWMIISVCFEGILVRMRSADILEQQMASGEYALANYHKELWEQFHVLAIDSRYVDKMQTSLKKNWKDNRKTDVDMTISNYVDLTQEDGNILRHQIREYMKYRETKNILDQIKESSKGVKDDKEVDDMKDKVEQIEEDDGKQAKKEDTTKEEQTEKTTETGTSEKTSETSEKPEVKDPRKGFKKLLSKGILLLVMPADKAISDKKVEIQYAEKQEDTDDDEDTPDFFKKESVSGALKKKGKSNLVGNIATEGLTAAYAAETFRCAVDEPSEKGLSYEMEYLIAGKEQERSNLKSVVHRLAAIRFALNYAYLFTNPAKQAQAYKLALIIGNVANLVPGVIVGIKLLLMAAWAYGEALIDVRVLLKGEGVPLTKNNDNWQLDLDNLATLITKEKPESDGITYKGYLQLLLLMSLDKKNTYMRMLDVMQQRIREEQKNFMLNQCLFSFQMTVKEKFKSFFYPHTYKYEKTRVIAY